MPTRSTTSPAARPATVKQLRSESPVAAPVNQAPFTTRAGDLLDDAQMKKAKGAAWEDYLAQHEALKRRASSVNSASSPALLFLGDSTARGWNTLGRQAADKFFPHLPWDAFGIGDDRIEYVDWRVRRGELANLQPRWLVLQVGTHNLSHDRDVDIVDGIAALADEVHCRLLQTRLVVASLLPQPSRDPFCFRELNARVGALNAGLMAHASARGYGWCDLTAVFTESAVTSSRLLPPDGAHPDADGYARLAEALSHTLETCYSDPLKSASPAEEETGVHALQAGRGFFPL